MFHTDVKAGHSLTLVVLGILTILSNFGTITRELFATMDNRFLRNRCYPNSATHKGYLLVPATHPANPRLQLSAVSH